MSLYDDTEWDKPAERFGESIERWIEGRMIVLWMVDRRMNKELMFSHLQRNKNKIVTIPKWNANSL